MELYCRLLTPDERQFEYEGGHIIISKAEAKTINKVLDARYKQICQADAEAHSAQPERGEPMTD